jgi:hypothetical protein
VCAAGRSNTKPASCPAAGLVLDELGDQVLSDPIVPMGRDVSARRDREHEKSTGRIHLGGIVLPIIRLTENGTQGRVSFVGFHPLVEKPLGKCGSVALEQRGKCTEPEIHRVAHDDGDFLPIAGFLGRHHNFVPRWLRCDSSWWCSGTASSFFFGIVVEPATLLAAYPHCDLAIGTDRLESS